MYTYEDLESAVKKNNFEKVQEIVEEGQVDITQPTLEGNILFLAIELKMEEIAIYLIETKKFRLMPIEKNVQINVLHFAAEKGCNKLLEYLIQRTDVDIMFEGIYEYNLLHWAIHGGIDTISLVLDTGKFNINCITKTASITPLIVACGGNGEEKVVNFLISKGADINKGANINFTGGKYSTPIQKAISSGNLKVVKALIAHSAKIFGDKTKELEEQFFAMIESTIEDVCDVSDPEEAIKLLNEITKFFRLRDPNEASLEVIKDLSEEFKDAFKDTLNRIKKDFQLFRYEKKSVYKLRQILREDDRSVWSIAEEDPHYDNYNPPNLIKSPSAFSSLRSTMLKYYPDLRPGDISIACYKMILMKQQELKEKQKLVSSQSDELKRLKEENYKLAMLNQKLMTGNNASNFFDRTTPAEPIQNPQEKLELKPNSN